MNDLQVFTNESFGSVRTVMMDGEPWFVGKDVAEILDYKNPNEAIQDHVDDEDKFLRSERGRDLLKLFSSIKDIQEKFGRQDNWFINESGVYSLVFGSHKPEAKAFKRWITHEVIPSIRKHGGYLTPAKAEEALLNPDTLIQLATALKEERAKRAEAEKQVEGMKPKALFADAVSTAETSILVGELAKLIKQNGVDMGEKRLFKWMRGNGYLISRDGADKNMPTQRSMELGLMEIKERAMNNPDGSVRITKTPKVTGKGQVYFVNKFIGRGV